jgi:hypothetical protein
MSRLSIELTEQQHQQIKAIAALQGRSIREYALERLLPMTNDEVQAMDELKALLVPRIQDGLAGKVSEKSITDIADEVLRDDSGA